MPKFVNARATSANASTWNLDVRIIGIGGEYFRKRIQDSGGYHGQSNIEWFSLNEKLFFEIRSFSFSANLEFDWMWFDATCRLIDSVLLAGESALDFPYPSSKVILFCRFAPVCVALRGCWGPSVCAKLNNLQFETKFKGIVAALFSEIHLNTWS